MKNLMKMFIVVFALLITFTLGCETEDPIPTCERDKVGTVTVKNSTGYNVYVDVTWGNVVENYEKRVNNGSSTKYTNVPAAGHPQSNGGTIEIWVSFDGADWYFNYENLVPCEDMTYTWYLNARKSANDSQFVVIDSNGKKHYPVRKEKI